MHVGRNSAAVGRRWGLLPILQFLRLDNIKAWRGGLLGIGGSAMEAYKLEWQAETWMEEVTVEEVVIGDRRCLLEELGGRNMGTWEERRFEKRRILLSKPRSMYKWLYWVIDDRSLSWLEFGSSGWNYQAGLGHSWDCFLVMLG